MKEDLIDKNAKIILGYMKLNMPLQKCDIVIGMGALDTRIAARCAELYLKGYSSRILFTGGLGKVTKNTQKETEASKFSKIAIKMGVPKDRIILEEKATNSGENIINTQLVLREMNIHPNSIIVVTKPYMERRVWSAYKKLWENPKVKILVTSPKLSYEEHWNKTISKELFLNVMVGDLQRIKEYPKLGYQIEQEIPAEVWKSYRYLVASGYTKYLL